MEYRSQLSSVSSNASTMSGFSSGFESMLGSPTSDADMMLSTLQELKTRMESLERNAGVTPLSSTPNTHHLRHLDMPRRDSTSSTASTIIGSAQDLQMMGQMDMVTPLSSTPNTHHLRHLDMPRRDSTSSTASTIIGSAQDLQMMGQMDMGPGENVFDSNISDGKLIMENCLKLTSENVDTMSKYQNVVIKFAIVGENIRKPQDCSCNHHGCSRHTENNAFQQLLDKLQALETERQKLDDENKELKGKIDGTETPKHVVSKEDDTCTSILEGSKETSEAEIQEIKTSCEEEDKKYIIKSVLDPKTEQAISLDDAIYQGIINLEQGRYFNPVTGDSMFIPEAMANNLIDVSFKTTKRTPRIRSSVGLLTIKKNVLPRGTLIVKQMKDTGTGEMVSATEAIARGITNKIFSVYRDITMQRDYHIIDAVEKGYVTLEDEDTGRNAEPEKFQCLYQISGVVDKRSGKTLSYHDAVSKGLVIKDLGVCKDTQSGKFLYVGYAIISGMMKVNAVDNGRV